MYSVPWQLLFHLLSSIVFNLRHTDSFTSGPIMPLFYGMAEAEHIEGS
jgi:hypothetical protein